MLWLDQFWAKIRMKASDQYDQKKTTGDTETILSAMSTNNLNYTKAFASIWVECWLAKLIDGFDFLLNLEGDRR